MPMLKSLAANNPRIQHPIGLACAAVAMVALTAVRFRTVDRSPCARGTSAHTAGADDGKSADAEDHRSVDKPDLEGFSKDGRGMEDAGQCRRYGIRPCSPSHAGSTRRQA